MEDCKLRTCVECRGTQFRDVEVPDNITLDSTVYEDTLVAQECQQCGEQYFSYFVLHKRSGRLAEELEKLDSPGPEAENFLRKRKKGLAKLAVARAAYEEHTSIL